jgi:uncharacterized ParB-like nuclease family protein
METLKREEIKTSQKFINPGRVEYWKEKISKGERVRVRVHKSDGAFYVLDGNHRLKAYDALNIKEIPVNLLEGKDLTRFLFHR